MRTFFTYLLLFVIPITLIGCVVSFVLKGNTLLSWILGIAGIASIVAFGELTDPPKDKRR